MGCKLGHMRNDCCITFEKMMQVMGKLELKPFTSGTIKIRNISVLLVKAKGQP
jgi:hypothetical protein